MTTRIVIKNSTVAGKVPTASDLVNAELAINLVDKKLYSKDAGGTVFEIGGTVGSGGNPPGSGNEIGDLWWDGDVLLVWNGSEWEVVGGVTSVNGETGEVELDLGDLNDVTLSSLNNGDIIAWNGSAWVNTAAPPADISGSSINDLNDVDTSGVDDGDILVWNQGAGEWQATAKGTVPEKTSELTNDGEDGSNPFITEADVNTILGDGDYLKSGDNVSELNNDAGYLTDAVTKIVAGTNITIDPASGEGEVTINAADAAALALDDLTDVNVPSPDSGDVLSYNGTNWVSSAAPPADISGSNLTQLNDVEAPGAADGDMLIYDGGDAEWVNTPAPTKTSDFVNDGNGEAGEVFITTGEVTNILNGLKPDGTPDAGNPGYLKPGDNVSELNNDAGYLTDADTAGDSDKLGGQDPDYYLNYQNFTNIPPTVDKIIAGTGIAISPVEGTGDVTVNSTVSALEFAGNVDVTDENTIPVVRAANKLYVNIGEGEFHPDWAAITNNASVASEAHPGDFMLLDVSDQGGDPWTWIDGGTPPSSDGLWTEAGGKLSPATLTNDVLVGGADAASAKIQLNATYGSGIFNSFLKVFDNTSNLTTGLCRAVGGTAYGLAIAPIDDENNLTASIKADGSATFAGNITTPRVLAIGPTANDKVWSGYLTNTNGAATSFINADGAATFAADVNVGNRNPGSSSSAGTRIANESGVSGVYTQSNSSVNQSSIAFQALRGTDEIFKVSYDGSATFAGLIAVDAGQPNENSTYGPGYLIQNRSAGTRNLWTGQLSGVETSTILADGSATFKGSIGVNGATTNNEAARFNLSATATNGLTVKSTDASLNSSAAFRVFDSTGDNTAAQVVLIKTDGSATFAGSVLSSSYNGAGQQSGYSLAPTGSLIINRESDKPAIRIYTEGTGSPTVTLNADGSSTFASTITAGGYSFAKLQEL